MVWGWLRRIPFKEVIFCVLVLQIMGERYPFSHFPMFSNLGDKSVWFQVENDKQEVLPYVTCFRFRASYLSKALKRETNILRKKGLDKDEALKQASQTLLAYLLERSTPELKDELAAGGLNMVEVTVSVDDDRLKEKRRVLASLHQP